VKRQASWIGDGAGERGMSSGAEFKEMEQKRRGKDTSSLGMM